MIDHRLLLCVLTGLGAGTIEKAAADSTIITTRSGTECVKMYDSTPDTYFTHLGAYNDSTNNANYSCPMTNNLFSLDAPYNFDRIYWYARVDDNNAASNVRCYIQSCNDAGSCTIGVSRATVGTGQQTLSTVGSIFAAPNHTTALTLRCVLPGKVGAARSGILKYSLFGFD